MNGEVLLDTNAVIGLFADDPAMHRRLARCSAIVISLVVLGELYYGAIKSKRVDENLKRIERLLAESILVKSDVKTAFEYGTIRNQLHLKGQPIPENDLWLAAVGASRLDANLPGHSLQLRGWSEIGIVVTASE